VLQHIQRLVTASAQTVYAPRVLRSRGLCDTALQHVYRATVIARLIYATSAWRSLASTSDRQRIDSVIDRARRNGYCAPDLPSLDVLCDDADDELFSKVVRLPNHVLHPLLPPPSIASQSYNLRERTHSLQLPDHNAHLSDKNFITHMLHKMHTRSRYSSQIYVIFLSILLMAQSRMLVMTLSMCCTPLLTLDTSALLWHAFCHVTNKRI